MPVFRIPDELIFPDPNLADEDGLLGVGGDLSAERLLMAYANGIFPWYSEGEPIMWWSPDPRCVLFPARLKISKSLGDSIRRKNFTVTFDSCFKEVIEHCSAVKRKGQQGTWITSEMQEAYIGLYLSGFTRSVRSCTRAMRARQP